MPGCLFCNIVAKSTPAQIVFENDHVLAFKDIRPVAPVHALVIPRQHITGIHEATPADVEVLGWRLGTLADKLQENNLAAVRILPKRFAELERNQPYVAFIGITPIAKG